MNKLQHLLLKLGEEAAEIIQIASKASQFGLDDVREGQQYTNRQLCHQEIDDILGVLNMLNEECGFGYEPNSESIAAKQVKVNKYLEYSKQLGLVEG